MYIHFTMTYPLFADMAVTVSVDPEILAVTPETLSIENVLPDVLSEPLS